MRNLKTILEDLDVQYTMPVQPVLLPHPPSGPGGGASQEALGNAGSFQNNASGLRAGKSFREGSSSFSK